MRRIAEKAYATLTPEYVIDCLLIMKEVAGVCNTREANNTSTTKHLFLRVERRRTNRPRWGSPSI